MCASSDFPAPLAKGAESRTSGREGSSKELGGPHTCAERAPERRKRGGEHGWTSPSKLPLRERRAYPFLQPDAGAGPCAARKPGESSLRPSLGKKRNPRQLKLQPGLPIGGAQENAIQSISEMGKRDSIPTSGRQEEAGLVEEPEVGGREETAPPHGSSPGRLHKAPAE